MTITLDKKYLVLPTGSTGASRRVTIAIAGCRPYVLDVQLCADNPQAHSYIDLENYAGADVRGKTAEIDLNEGEFALAEALPAAYDEALRPQVHFSPRLGWTNDPNGLYFAEGKYHLFFQHNPAGTVWGNMHWGHAVSTDLLHWTEGSIALYPDDMGTMFSGSAIIDRKNVTGLGSEDHPAHLLFYTAAGNPFTQCMAYSTDGGKTFVKYEKNPVIPHIAGANRDPKVIWCDELDAYVLALYLDGNTYALFRSDNLTDWSEIQRIDLPNDSECPDFYPLNEQESGERYWVLSGASDRYYAGKFAGGQFVPEEYGTLHDGPNVLYAAQTYSETPGRRIRFSWNTWNIPGMPFNCAMSVPCEMTLARIDGKLRLCANPIGEFASLRTDGEGAAFDIEGELTGIGPESTITVLGFTESLAGVPIRDGRVKVRIIADRTGFEAFFGQGEHYLVRGFAADMSASPLTVSGGEAAVTVHSLASIW